MRPDNTQISNTHRKCVNSIIFKLLAVLHRFFTTTIDWAAFHSSFTFFFSSNFGALNSDEPSKILFDSFEKKTTASKKINFHSILLINLIYRNWKISIKWMRIAKKKRLGKKPKTYYFLIFFLWWCELTFAQQESRMKKKTINTHTKTRKFKHKKMKSHITKETEMETTI